MFIQKLISYPKILSTSVVSLQFSITRHCRFSIGDIFRQIYFLPFTSQQSSSFFNLVQVTSKVLFSCENFPMFERYSAIIVSKILLTNQSGWTLNSDHFRRHTTQLFRLHSRRSADIHYVKYLPITRTFKGN